MTFFLGGHFEFFFLRFFFFFLLHLIKTTKGFYMRYHFFLYYGWFLQNLRKDFIRTNMHTTVQTTPSVVGSAEIPLWHEGSKTYVIVVCPTAFAIEKGVGDLWQSVVLCRVRAVV
jgi:hypothetical protein